jgi:putative membrane protein
MTVPDISRACLTLLPVAGYLAGVVVLRRRGDRWPISRSAAALGGFITLAVALMPPLASSEHFPTHVAQHLAVSMLAPLLLALSAPVTLALRTLPPAPRKLVLTGLHSRAARLLAAAPTVLALEVGGLYAYYLTGLFQVTEEHPWLHVAVHAHLFAAGCLFSWYLVGRDPMPARPGVRTRLIVLLIAAASHDVLAKLMYSQLLPRGGGTPAELHAGAQLMFYGGDAIGIALAVALLLPWYAGAGRRVAHDRRRAAADVGHGRHSSRPPTSILP